MRWRLQGILLYLLIQECVLSKDIQILQDGKVVLVDNNNPWLLVYEKSGNQVRKIQLHGVHYNITLIQHWQ